MLQAGPPGAGEEAAGRVDHDPRDATVTQPAGLAGSRAVQADLVGSRVYLEDSVSVARGQDPALGRLDNGGHGHERVASQVTERDHRQPLFARPPDVQAGVAPDPYAPVRRGMHAEGRRVLEALLPSDRDEAGLPWPTQEESVVDGPYPEPALPVGQHGRDVLARDSLGIIGVHGDSFDPSRLRVEPVEAHLRAHPEIPLGIL